MRFLRKTLLSSILTGLFTLAFAQKAEVLDNQSIIAKSNLSRRHGNSSKLLVWTDNTYGNAVSEHLRSNSTPETTSELVPTANDDAASTLEDNSVTIDILSNDDSGLLPINPLSVDFDQSTLGYQTSITTAEGTFTADLTGQVTFVPVANYNGLATVKYTVSDILLATSNEAEIVVTVTSVNDLPVAADDATTTNEDVSTTLNVVANDTDVEGPVDASTVDLDVSTGGIQNSITVTGGTFSVDNSGVVTYTPALNFNGTASTDYTVNDADGGTSNDATIKITVNPINDAPVAVNDATSTNEDNSVTLNVVSNDTDVEGNGTINVSTVDLDVSTPGIQNTFSSSGTFSVSSVGVVTYVPAANFNGSVSISYTVNDNAGATSNAATISITVNPVNDLPQANDDATVTDENVAVTLNVVTNDTDVEGPVNAASVDLDTGVSGIQNTKTTGQGTFTVNGSGVVTYTPLTNFVGTATLQYTVNDNSGATSNSATISITVNFVNQAPVAHDDAATTNEDVAVTINVTANDENDGLFDLSSVDLDPATAGIQSTRSTADGNYSVNTSTGIVTYTPALNFNSSTSITYTVKDNLGLVSNVATITITVTPVNDPPVAVNDATSTTEDTPVSLNVTTNDSDIDGSINVGSVDLDVTVSGIQTSKSVTLGSFSVNTVGLVTFTPVANQSGTATLNYTVNDNNGATSNSATITITIAAVNDPPVANNDATSTNEDNAVAIKVVSNDTDSDGSIDNNTVDLDVSTAGIQNTITNADGVYSVNSGGVVTYTPALNTNGTKTLSYTVNDNDGATSNPATITITVIPVNDAPVINSQTPSPLVTNEEQAITIDLTNLNVTDPDDTYPTDFTLIVSAGAGYSVSGNIITPNANFTGTLSVGVRVNDGSLSSNLFSLQIRVDPINDPPVITGQSSLSVNEDTPITLQLSNLTVTDPDNTYPTGFSLSVSAGSNYTVSGATVTPSLNFNGTLSVPVTVNDGTNNSNTFNVQITVNPVNDTPVITGQIPISISEVQPVTISLSQLVVFDPDNTYPTDFTLFVLSGSNYSVSGDVVTPAANFSGTLLVKVFVNDGNASSAIYNLQIQVNSVNDPPVITGQQSLSVNEDTPITIQFANLTVSDPDNTYPTGFTLMIQSGSNYTFSGTTVTPAANFNGVLSVSVKVNDGLSDSAPFNLQITVNPVNDAPVITAQQPLSTNEDTPLTIQFANLLVTDPDNTYPTGFTLVVSSGTNYTVSGTTITPSSNFSGTLTVPVHVNDAGSASSNTFNLSVTVNPVNDAPVITGQVALSTQEDTPITIKLSDLTVTDPDDTYPSGFTLAVSSGSNYTFSGTTITPATDFNGTLSVPVTVNDGSANSASFNLQITITPVNTAPKITGQVALSTAEDQAITIQFANLTVVDPDDSYPTGFTMTLSPGANYTVSGTTVTPASNFNGTLKVPVIVNDGISNSNSFNLQITVTPVNDAPVITGQAVLSVNEDTNITIQFANLTVTDPDDSYPSGFSITLSTGSNYTVSGNVVTPALNFNGVLSIPVKVNDGAASSNTFNLQITVNPVNDAPTSNGLPTITLQEDNLAAQTASLLNGFVDVEDPVSAFTYSIVSNTNAGFFQTLSIDQTKGDLLFSLKPNVFGTAKITIKMTDTGGLSVQDVITINVNAVNDPPSFDLIADVVIFENASTQTINVTNISSGPLESQSLLLTATSGNTDLIPQPSVTYNGTGATATISFKPVASQTGTAVITVKLVDTGLAEFTQTFTIQVNSINDAPTLDPIANVTVQEDAGQQAVALTGITAGPSENQVLTITASSNNAALFEVLNVTYTSPQATGTLNLKSKADAFGTATVTVTVTDDGPSTPAPNKNSVSRSFTFTVQPVNDPPVAVDDATTTNEDTPVTINVVANDTDVDGTVNAASVDLDITVAGIQNTKTTTAGTFSVNSSGVVTYTPLANFNGSASLDYFVNDNTGATSNNATITITVAPVNDPPTLDVIGNVTMLEDAIQLNISLTGITAGPGESQVLSLSMTSTNSALFDILDIVYTSPQTTATLRIKPKANAFGVATATVTVTDDGGNTTSRGFTITVQSVNDLPTFVKGTVVKDTAIVGDLYTYFIDLNDVDDNVLSVSATSIPSWLTIVNVALTPEQKIACNCTFRSKLSGTPPLTAPSSVSITILGKDPTGPAQSQQLNLLIDKRPVVSPIALTVNEDNGLSFTSQNFTTSFTDADANTLSEVMITTLPKHGTVSIGGVPITVNTTISLASIPSLLYLPSSNYNGKDTLYWNGSDGIAYSKTPALISLVINPVNDPPVLEMATGKLLYQIGIGQIQVISLDSISITDVDNDSLQSAEIGIRNEDFDVRYDLLADLLEFDNTANIKHEIDVDQRVITLTGKAPIADYVKAITSIQYKYDNSVKPKIGLKRVYVVLSDGIALSDTKDRQIELIYTFEDIDIVTGFTPNNDQVNDVWEVIKSERKEDLKDSKLFVYDKRGVMVYQSVGFEQSWDGRYKGEILPSDSYFFTIDIVDSKLPSLKKSYKGTVTILH
ncbi:MAG TPA: tandem-95 repeat protein [Cyclobacteriaceae bacterium]|nr:tandem-95 repeat protein [Cyclobacteriaceae bacterium]